MGENCVAKGAKRSKSVSIEESGHEAKKSREDNNKDPNLAAQELCFKICKCLQRQIALIHEDMNKRTQRLFSTLDNEQAENERLKQQLLETEKKLREAKDKIDAECTGDKQDQFPVSQSECDGRSTDAALGEEGNSSKSTQERLNIVSGFKSLLHSLDESGEKVSFFLYCDKMFRKTSLIYL